MKKIITLTFIIFTSCTSNVLAKDQYFCREAILHNDSSHTAKFVENGAILKIDANTSTSKRVHVSVNFNEKLHVFNARIHYPAKNSQGLLGSIRKASKRFLFEFANIPNYVETTTGEEFTGADLYFHKKDKFMLCDPELRNIFSEEIEECFINCQ